MRIFLTFFLLIFCAGPALANHPRILFDEGHGQVFVIEQEGELHLSRLARLFVDQHYEVSSTAHPLNRALLEQSDALVISGAFKPFSADEIEAVQTFLRRGGRLAVMVHIGRPLLPLLMRLGVDVGNGVIRENSRVIDSDPLNFRTSHLTDHPLNRGLDDFALYGCWPLRALTAEGHSLASTSDRSWVDLNRDQLPGPGDVVQSFDLVIETTVGKGKLLVFGDDALFQNRFLTGNNLKLAENLGRWLAGGTLPVGTEI